MPRQVTSINRRLPTGARVRRMVPTRVMDCKRSGEMWVEITRRNGTAEIILRPKSARRYARITVDELYTWLSDEGFHTRPGRNSGGDLPGQQKLFRKKGAHDDIQKTG